jgi:hypothetical protein
VIIGAACLTDGPAVLSGADWTGAAATRGGTAAAGGEGQEYQGGFRTPASGEDKATITLSILSHLTYISYFIPFFGHLLVLWCESLQEKVFLVTLLIRTYQHMHS